MRIKTCHITTKSLVQVLVALGIQAAISIVLTFFCGWLSDKHDLAIHLLLATVDTQIITGN
jgi:hypothetical protein